MYSPSRKVRASVRRSILLITIGCLCGLLFIETILELDSHSANPLSPTRSAGLMLNRSQMLLAEQVLLEPSQFSCLAEKSNPRPLYIIVKTRAVSSGTFLQRRMFTRTSWGREARSLGIPVVYAVARANDDHTQSMLEYESRIYGDMLQFNYLGKRRAYARQGASSMFVCLSLLDAYYNISIKTAGVLRWFVKHRCHQTTPYLFIVDDDVLVNLRALLSMITRGTFDTRTLYGLYLADIEPHPSGKWAVSLEDFPNRTYPAFVTGASTLYPSGVIPPIVDRLFQMIDRNQSIFFLDDVLISGVIAEQLAIGRAPMAGIDDCSCTNLFTRTIISECSHVRRIYVWSKFILTRIGQSTAEIDHLIDTTTTYVKWQGNFKQMRNGTALVLAVDPMSTFNRTLSLVLADVHSRIAVITLFTIVIVLLVIFLPKAACCRSPSAAKVSLHSKPSRATSSMLLAPVR